MEWHHKKTQSIDVEDKLTFPLLVDRTGESDRKDNDNNDGVVVLTESYEILDESSIQTVGSGTAVSQPQP